MRTYNEYCAAAKALDIVGARWTLLIVRELLLRGPSRYADLQHGLPGIATNLLADRLRELEHHGIVQRIDAPPPIATTLYELTPRGAQLRPVLDELVRWGAPLMARPDRNDTFHGHWLIPPAELFLSDSTPHRPPISVEVHADSTPVLIQTLHGQIRARIGTTEQPSADLHGPPEAIVGLLFGSLTISDARAQGLHITGAVSAVRRLTRRSI